MKIKSLLLLILIFNIIIVPLSRAEYWEANINKFREFNPDGEKYEFVKHFIKSLSYLQNSIERTDSALEQADFHSQGADRIRKVIDQIVLDNIHWRIARNMVARYHESGNKFIRKATRMYMNVCDEQIGYNHNEREMLEEMYQFRIAGGEMKDFKRKYAKEKLTLNLHRKETMKRLLESAMLISKILISDEANEYGELVKLAITEEQRDFLLDGVDEFQGDGFEGDMRQGQTFIQASISAIREMLEDNSWDMKDG